MAAMVDSTHYFCHADLKGKYYQSASALGKGRAVEHGSTRRGQQSLSHLKSNGRRVGI